MPSPAPALAYGLDDLIAELDALVASERDPRRIIGRASDSVRRLVAREGALPERFLRATNPSGTTRNLVHKHPQGRYVVLAVLWPPGYETPVHDHEAWGVSGVHEGAVRVTNYVRTDDGSRAGHASLEEHSSLVAGRGSVTYVLPPAEEIHKIGNPTAERAVTLHVYGRDMLDCNVFDLNTGRISRLDMVYHNLV